VDALEKWADGRQEELGRYSSLQINMDNGPHVHSRRTQFVKRIMLLACRINKNIELVYYPPYHSKYNPIESAWAALENYWNSTLLDSVEKTIETAKNMTWKGIRPNVELIDKTYLKGVKLDNKEMRILEKHIIRNPEIPKWHITRKPNQEMRKIFFT